MTSSPSRRRFVTEAARAVFGASAAGAALWLGAGRTAGRPSPDLLRPPGALPENAFLAACLRCGRCVARCPPQALRIAEPGSEMAAGTPFFVARRVPCAMCPDMPCVAACPSGALDKGLKRIADARMGTALLPDEDACLNRQGVSCDICFRVCPRGGTAIRIERTQDIRGRPLPAFPRIDASACTGCGKCEKNCNQSPPAIRVAGTAWIKRA